MPGWTKLLIGLLAVLLLGWVQEGPLGNGKLYIDTLETQARAAVAEADLPGIAVRLDRAPLRRVATLSGPADRFQRDGMGSFKGLTERVDDVPGIGQARWADEPAPGGIMLPLLAEILLLMLGGYLLGLLFAALVVRRKVEGRYA